MRVALVSEHACPIVPIGGADAGGQNVHVAALARALAALGHEVVVHTRRHARDAGDLVELGPRALVHHVTAGPPVPVAKDDLLPYVPELADGLARFWRRWRPDVIHAHFWMSGMASLLAARGQTPVAQTFHALGVVKRRHLGLADTSPRSRLAEERRLGLRMDRIVATCADEVAELSRMGISGSRVSVVPCGVDTAVFHPDGAAAPRPAGRQRLLTLGRLVPRKGVDDVIRALRWLPDTDLLVGGGPDGALDRDPEVVRLRAEAEANGVAERVTFLGGVPRERVPALLRSADVVVSYPWYEPFGIVPLEAMACGVPVVVADVGGLRDTVVHEVTGLRVPPHQPRRLAGQLWRLLDRPQTAASMGRAGTERARSRYAWPRVADGTVEVYRRMLQGRAQRSVG